MKGCALSTLEWGKGEGRSPESLCFSFYD